MTKVDKAMTKKKQKLLKELALQLWGGQLGGDANDKAVEMLPWLETLIKREKQALIKEIRKELEKVFNDYEYDDEDYVITPHILELEKQAQQIIKQYLGEEK